MNQPTYKSIFSFKNLNSNQLAVVELIKEAAIIFAIVRAIVYITIETEIMSNPLLLTTAITASLSLFLLFWRLWNTPVEKHILINDEDIIIEDTQDWVNGKKNKQLRRIDM